MNNKIDKLLVRHKKMKKIYFIIESILLCITIFNFILALIIGRKYDIIFIIPIIISLITMIIFLTYYDCINLNKIDWKTIFYLDYINKKQKLITIVISIVFGSSFFINLIFYFINGGSAVIRNGEFVIAIHQTVVKSISESEYIIYNFFQKNSMLIFIPIFYVFIMFLKYYDDYEIIKVKLLKCTK